MASTNRDSDRFMLRLPEGMRDEIKVAAEQSGVSMNAIIVDVLERTFPRRSQRERDLQGLLALTRRLRYLSERLTAEERKEREQVYHDLCLSLAEDLRDNPDPYSSKKVEPRGWGTRSANLKQPPYPDGDNPDIPGRKKIDLDD